MSSCSLKMNSSGYRYPIYEPFLGESEKKYVMDCLESNWISSRGKYVEEFEERLSTCISNGDKSGQALTVSNGTLALQLAMLALGISGGDEVIVPSFTYIATSNCVEHVGAIPIFADSDPDDWSLDVESVKSKITDKTKCVIAVHLYGIATDLSDLKTVCDEHGLFLVEDCAESLGAYVNRTHCGRKGHISTFSFFGNKTITTGEGGAIYTEIPHIFKRCQKLKSQGLAEHREYWHDIIGYNFRMTNISAAIGCGQMEKLDHILDLKRGIDLAYRNALLCERILFQQIPSGSLPSFWMTSIVVESETIRDTLRVRLKEHGVETRPTFFPIHTMPMYSKKFSHLPNCERIATRGINLPSFPALTIDDIGYISQKVLEELDRIR
jgi:perosamine synthetase